MSTTPNSTAPNPDPKDDRHGVDHARERRLILIFAGLIGLGFVIAGILVGVAMMFEFTGGGNSVEPPDFMTEPAPASAKPAQISHP